MIYRSLMTLTAAIALTMGIFFYGWGPMALSYLGEGFVFPLPVTQGNLKIWSAISFTRGNLLRRRTTSELRWVIRDIR